MITNLGRAEQLADAMLIATWFGAIATGAAALVAGAALIAAAVQIKQTGRAMQRAARSEAADSEARTRPYVSVSIVPGLAGPPTLDLVIENRGSSTARLVKLRPSRAGFDASSPTAELAAALERMLTRGFTLAPGERRRVFWRLDGVDSTLPREQQPPSVVDCLALTYEWLPDDGSGVRCYEETVDVDLSDMAVLIPSPQTGATTVEPDGIERRVADLTHAVRALAQHTAEQYR